MLESEPRDRGTFLFQLSHGSDAVDQTSRGGQIRGRSSVKIGRRRFLNFEMLDAKIASALEKSILNSCSTKVSLSEQEAQLGDRLLRGRQIAFMIYEYIRVTGAHEPVLDYSDLFRITLHGDNIQDSDTRWDQALCCLQVKCPSKMSWKVCTR